MKALFSVLAALLLSSCYYAVPYYDYYDGYYDDAENDWYSYSQSGYATETYYNPYGGTIYVNQNPSITYINNYGPEVVYVDNPLLDRRPRHHFKPDTKHKAQPSHRDDKVKSNNKVSREAAKKKNDAKKEKINRKMSAGGMPKKLFK